MAKASENNGKEGDPLKTYTLVMALLVVVMGVLYFMIDGVRKDYVEANQRLQRWMAFQGPERAADRPPNTIPDLAWEVESLSYTFEQASGGGGLERSISQTMMDSVATQAGLRQNYASRVRPTPTGNYETISQRYEYKSSGPGAPEVWRLLALAWLVEERGRYRVSELSWQVADNAENPEPPFDRIKNPTIEVSLRVPILE